MDEIKLYASIFSRTTKYVFPPEITGYAVRDDVDKLGISVVLLEMEV